MMKTRSFLLSTLAVFIFAGCSSEDAREGNIPGGELDGKAYLSLSLQSHTATSRAVNVEEKPGSSGESKAGAVKVLLFDEDDVCLESSDRNTFTHQDIHQCRFSDIRVPYDVHKTCFMHFSLFYWLRQKNASNRNRMRF